jgi:hypothetical protein
VRCEKGKEDNQKMRGKGQSRSVTASGIEGVVFVEKDTNPARKFFEQPSLFSHRTSLISHLINVTVPLANTNFPV